MKRVVIWLLLLAVSIGVMYWIAWANDIPWQLTESILLMIGLHELGHLTAAKRLGYKTAGFYFLPGLGGAAILKEIPRMRWDCFTIWYAGPLVGFLETALLAGINLWWQSELVGQIVGVWAFINFVNLMPIIPLDGGMIAWSILGGKDENYLKSLWFWILTFMSVFFLSFISSFIALLVLFFAILQRGNLISMWEKQGDHLPMTPVQAMSAANLTFILVLALFALILYG